MFTLVHGFYKYVKQKDEYCVLILGLDNAGKTVSKWGLILSAILNLSPPADLLGASEDETDPEVRGDESQEHNDDSRTQHWPNRRPGHSIELLGSRWPGGVAVVVGQGEFLLHSDRFSFSSGTQFHSSTTRSAMP